MQGEGGAGLWAAVLARSCLTAREMPTRMIYNRSEDWGTAQGRAFLARSSRFHSQHHKGEKKKREKPQTNCCVLYWLHMAHAVLQFPAWRRLNYFSWRLQQHHTHGIRYHSHLCPHKRARTTVTGQEPGTICHPPPLSLYSPCTKHQRITHLH